MNNIIDWNSTKTNSISDQLEKVLISSKIDEIEQLNNEFEDEELEEELSYLEEDYAIYDLKLKKTVELLPLGYKEKRKYFELMVKTDQDPNMSFKRKLGMMLSFPVLIVEFRNVLNLSDEEIMILAAATTKTHPNDYDFFISILSDPRVSKTILISEGDFAAKVKKAYAVMDAQNLLEYNTVADTNYEELVNHALNILEETKNKTK